MVETATRRMPAIRNTEWLNVLPPATRFAFYGDGKARAAALSVWGVAFSEEACRANAQTPRATLWMGPDEYLLLDFAGGQPPACVPEAGQPAAADPSFAMAEALEGALVNVAHALVDISHRQFALEVSGPLAPTILSGACPLDLDITEFPIGMCTRTVFAKAGIVLWRTRADAFHLEVWRSFSGYVTGVLQDIAKEFFPSR